MATAKKKVTPKAAPAAAPVKSEPEVFKAIVLFKDSDGRTYKPGEVYEGKRIEALSTKDNKVGYPVIKKA